MDGTWISLEKEDMLRNILEKLKNKGKKVLFIIDEIINEYSYAAEPPVQFRLSHLSRRSEPL